MNTRHWRQATTKIINHAIYYRLPDRGGIALLEMLGDSWHTCLEDALATGKWDFMPFAAHFSCRDKMQTLSSLLDRLLMQLVLAEPGWRMQQELINACCDDDLMPLPPAFRFRPPQASHVYSNWLDDYRLWQDAQLLFAIRGYKWMVKCDIRDCFYCIDRRAAADVLQQFIRDSSHRKLLSRRLNSCVEWQGIRSTLGGLPVEEPCSHLLANAFLCQFDEWVVRELAVPHVRFVDDMRFFCNSEDEADRLLRTIREVLQVRYGLRLNEDKSSVEALGHPAGETDAAELLKAMKARIAEPLEEHFGLYCRRPIDEVLDVWNEVQRAIELGTHSDAEMRKHVDFLASLRPGDEGSEACFIGLMKSVIARACAAEAKITSLQQRIVGIAMRHLRCASPCTEDVHLAGYLEHRDQKIAGMAFSNLVKCRTAFANQAAEEHILSLMQSGHEELAKLRFRTFIQSFGTVSARLRAAFGDLPDWTMGLLTSSPSHSVTPCIAELIKGLSSGSALTRRNSAIQLAMTPTDQPEVIRQLGRAMRAEKHRDARLAMLIAAKTCSDSYSSVNFGKSGLPRTKLEMVVLLNWNRLHMGIRGYLIAQHESHPSDICDKAMLEYAQSISEDEDA